MKRYIIAVITLAALALGLAGCSHPAAITGPCTFTEARTASHSTADAKGVNVKGANGAVKVIGRPDLQEVRVSGTACATSEASLRQITLKTERSSDGWVRVLVDLPRSGNNKLDITVEVPADLALIARNDNGTLDVSHLNRGADVRGDNGTVTVTDVHGGATVQSRNGAVTVTGVEGNVNVTRADNGILVVSAVKGNVTLTKKNGAVTVLDVTGDLTVTQKVNGLVTHKNIGGKVYIAK